MEIRLPELGENIEEVDVAAVLVSVGDEVKRDQPLIEVETEKASLEVPSTGDGRIEELLVSVGDKLKVDQVIVRIVGAGGATAKPKKAPATRAPAPATQPAPEAAQAAPESTVVELPVKPARREIGSTVPAAPSVRALARELGVEIAQVPGSGPAGRISRDDVKLHAKSLIRGRASVPGAGPAAPTPLPDFSEWGEVERERLTNVRRATAGAMANAWSTVPHVTQFDRADVTQLESMRKRFNARPEAATKKLTMTAIVVKMVAAALKQFPKFNASLDVAGDSLVLKKYVHVGVAVDTERGLLVPVIRDVDKKSLTQVTQELNDLATRARAKKVRPDEMRGASFTVSNLGGLGTTHFSPIVNWPEVAILGVGRAENTAVHVDGAFQPRLMMPLSVSYDHRIIDGADAARFARWLAEALEQPLLLLMDD
ncbi:MAG: branched-chain alpha-keto acid dehydrogenase subunit E2 [bacterium]|nr:branched-chain alpha-keto acid dehydrogenase subunit E2 [bacterium]